MPVDLNYAPPQPPRRHFLRWSVLVLVIVGVAFAIATSAIFLLRATAFDPNRIVRRAIQSRLESAVASGATTFDFGADQSFAWDRMYVFGPYTDQRRVESTLGFKWPGYNKSKIERDEGICLVVFVKQGAVVGWYEQPRTIDLAKLENDTGYARSESMFPITPTGDGRHELKPVRPAQPATVPTTHKSR